MDRARKGVVSATVSSSWDAGGGSWDAREGRSLSGWMDRWVVKTRYKVGIKAAGTQLTRRRPNPFGDHGLISPRCLAQRLVTGTYADNGEQGHDEAEVGCDVPLAEDDAEVVGGPSEEHLMGSVMSDGSKCGEKLTFMLHMWPPPPWSMSPWSMPPCDE